MMDNLREVFDASLYLCGIAFMFGLVAIVIYVLLKMYGGCQ